MVGAARSLPCLEIDGGGAGSVGIVPPDDQELAATSTSASSDPSLRTVSTSHGHPGPSGDLVSEPLGPDRPRWWDSVVDRIDGFQQRRPVTAVPTAVAVKYVDDGAGRLTTEVAHTAFLAVFPLLLILLTVLEIVLAGHPAWQRDITDAVLHQFPVLGTDLTGNIKGLSRGNALALVVLLVWLFFGATRMSRNAQTMMAVVWGVPRDDRPGFFGGLRRSARFLAVIGGGFLVGGFLAGAGVFGDLGPASPWIGFVALVVVNTLTFWMGYAVLIPLPDSRRAHLPGALVAAVGWSALQQAGAQLVNHQLRHFTTLYGAFAVVIVLIWWIAIGVTMVVWSAELNVVLARTLWPRSLRRRQRAETNGAFRTEAAR